MATRDLVLASPGKLPPFGSVQRHTWTVITNVTDIIIAGAAVFGLVPLGVRTVHDMVKNRRRKKSNDMLLTVAVSVIASHAAPAVLTELAQRLGAVAEQLPPWAKAALGAIPPPSDPAAQPAPSSAPQTEASVVSQDAHGSPTGSSNGSSR